MMMPSIFGENLFDSFMNDFAFPVFSDRSRDFYGKRSENLMKTDVRETESGYQVDMDLPGFKKENIQMHLENGYLTVSAVTDTSDEEKNENGRYVRRERSYQNVSRSFYVGENITENDIHPKYENGILSFQLPKAEKKAVESKKYIAIEG